MVFFRNLLSALTLCSLSLSSSATISNSPILISPFLPTNYQSIPEKCVPNDKDPQWLLSSKDPIKEQMWYRNWLSTTTTFCANLHKAQSDNAENSQFKEIIWAAGTTPNWLFSGSELARTPDEVFTFGLVPANPNYGHLKLVAGGDAVYDSALIYTSRNGAVAPAYGKYVYVINAPGGIDADRSVGKEQGAGWDEIDFAGGVQTRFIHGSFIQTDYGDTYGMPFVRYEKNPHYIKCTIDADCIVPEDEIEMIITKSGLDGEQLHVLVNDTFSASGLYKINANNNATLRALNADGTPNKNVQWWVNGHTGERASSCAIVPMGVNIDRHIMLTAQTESFRGDWTENNSDECVYIYSEPLRDGQFLDYNNFPWERKSIVVLGNFGGWNASPAVILHSALSAQTGSDSQAIELNSQTGYAPGSIKQTIHPEPSQIQPLQPDWNLSFRVGSNPKLWCAADSEKFPGKQTFEVSIGFNLGASNQDILVKKSFSVDASQQWRNEIIEFTSIYGGMDFVQNHPQIQFQSTSKEGEACGALVSDIALERITN
ncbi:scabin-related ADP-ribosyltransferase [Glaciimonas sp. GG7]